MKIAIVGAGLAGLAVAFHLVQKRYVPTIFYELPGASMAASGLLHPYPGDKGIKAYQADEAYQEALMLMTQVSSSGPSFYKEVGFDRMAITPRMNEGFSKQDPLEVKPEGEALYFIKKGTRVEVPLYLEAVKTYLTNHQVPFKNQKIASLDELKEYDRVIIAAGYGIAHFPLKTKLKYLKGQSLYFQNAHQHKRPLLAKGYLVPFDDKVIIGTTYERAFTDEKADLKVALSYLQENIKQYFEPYDKLLPQGVLSGVRVAHPNRNIPQVILANLGAAYLTGLGSRGLLYHALIGKLIAGHIEDLSKLPAPWLSS